MSDRNWNIEKINQFVVNGIEENTHLDYKGPGAISKANNAKKEISKDVSAFANSAGGVIIYGIKEYDENDKRHLPEKIDPINGQEYSKEWLEQIINTTISPRINNIKIIPIQTSKKEENQLIFVVDIPKSNTAHQAKDKRYYKRYNFESLIMEDWEIKDIINRQQKIDLDIKFKTTEKNPFFRKFLLKSSTIELEIWISNKGNKVAEYVDCFISGDANTSKNILFPKVDLNGFEFFVSNIEERKLSINGEQFLIKNDRFPILPQTSRIIGSMKIRSSFIDEKNEIQIQIATDDNSKILTKKGEEILE